MDAHPSDPKTAQAHQFETIHSKGINGHLSGWRQSDDFCRIFAPDKVVTPELTLWVEQGGRLTTGARYNLLSISFIAIAGWTGQTEILQLRLATTTPGNNVVDFEDHDAERLGR